MFKKLEKISLIALIAFLTLITTTNAKKMDASELGAEVLKKEENAGFVYVIGSYAFTSEFKGFDIQDVMLAAANSIKINDITAATSKEDLLNKALSMTIYEVRRSREGWNYAGKLIGNGTAFDGNAKVDIRYIDYQFIPEETKFSVNEMNSGDDFSKLTGKYSDWEQNGDLKVTKTVEGDTIKLSGLIPITKKVADLEETSYYLPLMIEMDNQTITENSIVKINDTKIEYNNLVIDGNKLYILKPLKEADAKTFTISIDLDSDKEYAAKTFTIDWTDLKLQKNTKATLSTDVDSSTLSTNFGYEKDATRDTYSLTKTNLTGKIVEHYINQEPFNGDGYYVALKLSLEAITEQAKISLKLQDNSSEVTSKYIINDKDVIMLIKLTEEMKTKQLEITVDSDSTENHEYLETKYTINLNATLEKSSEATVKSEIPNELKENIKSKWQWDIDELAKTDYKLDIPNDGIVNNITLNESILPPLSNINSEASEVYYMVLTLHTTHAKTESLSINSDDNNVTVLEDETKTNDIVILKKLTLDQQSFKLTIDLDGDVQEDYAPYEITFDLSNVIYQEHSAATIKNTEDGTYTISNNNIIGTINQSIIEGKKDYYLDLTVTPNEKQETAVVKICNKEDAECNKTYDFSKGIVYTLKDKSEIGDANNQALLVIVDYDGDAKKYLPVTYTLDYKNLTFKKLFTVTFKNGQDDDPIETQEVIEGENATSPKENPSKEYHEFEYWAKEGEKNDFNVASTPISEDTTLVPHWKILTKDYINSVLTLDGLDTYLSKTDIDGTAEFTVTLKLPNQTMTIFANNWFTKLGEVLDKEEIESIKLSMESQNATLTSSADIAEKMNSFLANLDDAIDKEITIDIKQNENYNIDNSSYTVHVKANYVIVDDEGKLKTALSGDKKIYVKSDIKLEDQLEITKAATIDSYDGKPKKISVENQDNVINITGNNVSLANLAVTGGKNSQIIIDNSANVTINNLDVSGEIQLAEFETQSVETVFSAAIILKSGNLNVEGTLTNENENYDVPTIRIPLKTISPGSSKNYNGKVTPNDTELFKNSDYYYRVKSVYADNDKVIQNFDRNYYLTKENSIMTIVTFTDQIDKKDGHIWSLVKYYTGNMKIDHNEIKAYRDSQEDDDPEQLKIYEFVSWYRGYYPNLGTVPTDNLKVENFANEVLDGSHMQYSACYKRRPQASVNYQSINGLTANDDGITGVITTKTDGVYAIPVTLKSERFTEATKIQVTNPNGEVENYDYNGDKIAKIIASEVKEINLQLEAIKASDITKNDGKKLYKIVIDYGNEEFPKETYQVDYSQVKTIEEVINEAAENTQNASNLTVKSNTKMRGQLNDFTKQYDKTLNRELITYGSAHTVEYEYVFHPENKEFVPYSTYKNASHAEQNKAYTESKPEGYYHGDWRYAGNMYHGLGISEVELLKDVVQDLIKTNAIGNVTTNEDGSYNVTLSQERLNIWLNENYSIIFDHNSKFDADADKGSASEDLTLKVELMDVDGVKYIKSITSNEFTTNSKSSSYGSYSDNKFDITISNIGSTNLPTPSKMILDQDESEETKATLNQIIANGKNWWTEHIK